MPAALFRPPPVEITAELRWLLLRAFGPAGAQASGPVDGGEVLRLARTYRLVQRLAARTPSETLVGELGRDAALRLVSLQTLGEAKSRALAAALPGIAAAAEAASAPVVLLKYAALLTWGAVTPISRRAVDIDVLVGEPAGAALFSVLKAIGFSPAADGDPAPRGHLPQLVDGSGTVRVEIHTSLLGIRGSNGRSPAGLSDLVKAGALSPAPGLASGCFLPSRDLIVAHLLVHGIVQHGFSPSSYSLFKMFADLIDLGVAGQAGNDLVTEACRWLPDDRWRIDVDAVRALCRALAMGEAALLGRTPTDVGARLLLDHCLAGPADTSYRRRLKVRRVFFVGSLRGRLRTVGRAVRSAVYLSRREIDAHYGVPRSRWGYLGYRLLWPLDVLFHKLPSAAFGLIGRPHRRRR